MIDEDRVAPLISSLSAITAQNGSGISFDVLDDEHVERVVGFDPKSRNPIIRFVLNDDGTSMHFVAFTLVLNGLQRSNSRVEAFARALAANEGKFFCQNPLLIVFDYVGNRLLMISAAKLFGAFLDKTRTETISASKTASFTLSPHFENATISMYGTLRAPDVKIASLEPGVLTSEQLKEWLLKLRDETVEAQSRASEISSAIKTRFLARQSLDESRVAHESNDLFDLSNHPPGLIESGSVSEEMDNVGTGTGVEAEKAEASEEEKIAEPFDPENIDVITRSMTVDLLLSRASSEMIDLQPDFQRRWGIWDNRRQSRLIESLLLRIPLPVLYAAENEDERWEIVDGIQRLSTIARFIRPEIIESDALVLTGLEYLTNYNGKRFSDLTQRLQMRLRETELVIHLIRKGTPPAVKFNIFARINTGGIALSSQELRHAITPGRARVVLEEWASSDSFKRATDGSVRPIRMDDRELVLRFIAFYSLGLEAYKQPDMDGFLVSAMKAINGFSSGQLLEIGSAFYEAMNSAHAIFGRNAFRKRFTPDGARLPINKALFESISVNLAQLNPSERERLSVQAEKVDTSIIALCNDRSFEAAISQGTGDVRKVQRRFRAVSEMFQQVLNDA